MHNGPPPPISLLNISVYKLQPRLFMDSPPYLKKNQKDHKELRFAARLDQAIVLLALSFSFSQYLGLRVFFTLLPVIKLIKDH